MRLLALAIVAFAVVILVVGWRATADHGSKPCKKYNSSGLYCIDK